MARQQGDYRALLSVAEGLDISVALNRGLDAAMVGTGAEYAALGVYGPTGEVTEFLHRGMSEELRERIGPLPRGVGLLGELAQRTEPLRLKRVADHPRATGFPPNHPAMGAFLGVPIIVGEETFGSIYLTNPARGRFTAENEEFVRALAAALAVAIRNSRAASLTRQRERWQRAATAIDYAVLAGADPGEVLELVAAEARRLSGADVAVIALPDRNRKLAIEVVDVRNAGPAAEARWSVDRSHLPETAADQVASAKAWLALECDGACLLVGSFATGQTMLAPGFPTVNDAGRVGVDPAFGTTVAIPMRTPDRSLGVLGLLWDHQLTQLGQASWEVAESFAAQATVTLVLAESRQEHERLMVFEDRDRIARDMHDLVVQRVFAAGMSLQTVLRSADLPQPQHDRIARAIEDLDETIREIRRTIFELHDQETARPANRTQLLREVAHASVLLGFTPQITITGEVEALPGRVADHLLAALREALSNTSRHAQAAAAWVSVEVSEGEVVLTVTDDGIGLPEVITRESGLANLTARARELAGSCDAVTGPDGGTVLTWRVRTLPVG